MNVEDQLKRFFWSSLPNCSTTRMGSTLVLKTGMAAMGLTLANSAMARNASKVVNPAPIDFRQGDSKMSLFCILRQDVHFNMRSLLLPVMSI
jgi:hypothetical protein